MNILLLSAEYPPLTGGISSFAAAITAGLESRGHSVRVTTTVTGQQPDEASVQRIGGRAVGRFTQVPILAAAAINAALRDRPDAVICMKPTVEGMAGLLLKRLLDVPFAVVVHGSEVLAHQDGAVKRRLLHQVFAHADVVVTNSLYTRSIVAPYSPTGDSVTVYPSVDLARHQSVSTSALTRLGLTGRPFLLTVGQVTERKGHLDVVELLPDLIGVCPELAYVVAGRDGDATAALAARTKALGLDERLIVTGTIPQADLVGLYQHCTAYVMPGRVVPGDVEGFGLAYLEANLHGKPVVACRTGGVTDAVVDGTTGLVVEAGDSAALFEAIRSLLQVPGLARALGSAGRQRVLTGFTSEAQAIALEAALVPLASRAPSSPPTPVARKEFL